MPDRFGIAGLRHTDGPRRLSDFGLTSAALSWACTIRLADMLTTDPGGWTESYDWFAIFGMLTGEVLLGYARDPGTLGDPAAYADTVDPDDDRILTVDDLLPFGSE